MLAKLIVALSDNLTQEALRMEAHARGIRRRTVFAPTPALNLRFWNKVHRLDTDQCWPWLGAIRNGYGAIKHERHLLSAHVVAWVLSNNRMPDGGMIICHTCDNRLCCNPSHLYDGTYADNLHDADRRRSIARPHGEEIPTAVLTDDLVRLILAIRVINGWGCRRLSRALNLKESTIDGVLRRTKWLHVPVPSSDEAASIVWKWKQSQ